MDAADYDFARIPEFDMKELKLFETVQCGKKRTAEDHNIDKGVAGEKKVKVAGPLKKGREAAAKYWQSLIDAGKGPSIGAKIMKEEHVAPPDYQRSLTLEVRATKKILGVNKATFTRSIRAKLFSNHSSHPRNEC